MAALHERTIDEGKASEAEPRAGERPAARPENPALSGLAFPGCDRVPMTLAEYRRSEYPLEMWDAASHTAWRLREGPTWEHEGPSQALAQMAALIAAARGSTIKCYGAMGMVRDGDPPGRRLVLHPDQTVYLHPAFVEQEYGDPLLVVGASYPDVVLEVDHTTDVRPGKLRIYESWGVPELWVEVPDQSSRSRPASLRPGLTIRLLRNGAYRESPVSRAFPGWRAEDVHEGMNEIGFSERTCAILEHLGRRLGAREGTGPDDDPFLRSFRAESREEGRAAGREEGHAKGLAEGREEGLADAVREVLRLRGVEVSEGFPGPLPDPDRRALLAAALACDNERDFLVRIRKR